MRSKVLSSGLMHLGFGIADLGFFEGLYSDSIRDEYGRDDDGGSCRSLTVYFQSEIPNPKSQIEGLVTRYSLFIFLKKICF